MIKIIITALFAFIFVHLYMFHMENYKAFNIGDCVKMRDFTYTWIINKVKNKKYHLLLYVNGVTIYVEGVDVDFVVANNGFLTNTTCEHGKKPNP